MIKDVILNHELKWCHSENKLEEEIHCSMITLEEWGSASPTCLGVWWLVFLPTIWSLWDLVGESDVAGRGRDRITRKEIPREYPISWFLSPNYQTAHHTRREKKLKFFHSLCDWIGVQCIDFFSFTSILTCFSNQLVINLKQTN